jgi:hypothetical protein
MRNCLAMALAAIMTAVSNPPDVQSHELQNCEIAYNKFYRNKPLHKAAATTGGRALRIHPTACGFSNGFPTRKRAEFEAIKQCKKAKRAGYPGACSIIESR